MVLLVSLVIQIHVFDILSSYFRTNIYGESFLSGGLVAGPIGMAIGGTVGGLSAWKMSEGN